jgi:hypothetical protein
MMMEPTAADLERLVPFMACHFAELAYASQRISVRSLSRGDIRFGRGNAKELGLDDD